MRGHARYWGQVLHKYPNEEPRPEPPSVMAYKITGTGPAGTSHVWLESFDDVLPWVETFVLRYSHVTMVRKPVRF